MDPLQNDESHSVLNRKVFYLLIASVSISQSMILGAFFGSSSLSNVSIPGTVSQNDIYPITYEIFENPTFDSMTGRYIGRVISKDETSITITPVKQIFSKDGNLSYENIQSDRETKIIIFPEVTEIYTTTQTSDSEPEEKVELDYDGVEIGSLVDIVSRFTFNTNSEQLEMLAYSVKKINR